MIGFIIRGDRRSTRHEGREPARTNTNFRWMCAGGGNPAEPRRAERRADLPLFDAVNWNAEHVCADLRPERGARPAAHEINLRDRQIATQGNEIVARGKGDAFQHRLNDIVASSRTAKTDEGAGCSGVIMWRAPSR